jgi:hypothetical protein
MDLLIQQVIKDGSICIQINDHNSPFLRQEKAWGKEVLYLLCFLIWWADALAKK